MPDIFESDFKDFISALNFSATEYIIVGGYAVILHGYYRTTNDLDVWVNKTPENYLKLRKAYAIFGMPFQIDVMTKLKGVEFTYAMEKAEQKELEGLKVRFLNLADLIKAKTASGRYKDLDDIEKLTQ